MDLLAFVISISESLCLTNKAVISRQRSRRDSTMEEVAEPSTSTEARSMPPVVHDAQLEPPIWWRIAAGMWDLLLNNFPFIARHLRNKNLK
ncbi:Lipoprotein MlpH [Trichinella spiralis]|uniref:Lipoprotein MlpH n=1 Tax=Trichinella spiralis TaxID=6334 RepID=A0ABR3KLP9_TRISP